MALLTRDVADYDIQVEKDQHAAELDAITPISA